jgi:uncharacterized membrane protein YphA (DoxX/SURF4 family)
MKPIKILYWVVTSVFALMMIYSGVLYLTSPEMEQAFTQMGFPSFLRVELGVAKIVGSIVLLAPVPARLREWAYAGVPINLVSALIAHISLGHPASVAVMPGVFFVALIISYITYNRLKQPDFSAQPA